MYNKPNQCWRELLQPGRESEAVESRCEVKDPKASEAGNWGLRSRRQAVKGKSRAGDQAELNFLRQSGDSFACQPLTHTHQVSEDRLVGAIPSQGKCPSVCGVQVRKYTLPLVWRVC